MKSCLKTMKIKAVFAETNMSNEVIVDFLQKRPFTYQLTIQASM